MSLTGLFAIAVTFGPARVNYGLFLPYVKEEFDLSTTALGVIASGLHAGNLLALVAVAVAATRIGTRAPVLVGLASAAVGLSLMAVSHDVGLLTVGVILAGTGAGWTWSPYNDVAAGELPGGLRDRVLSVVSTGGTVGMLAAGAAVARLGFAPILRSSVAALGLAALALGLAPSAVPVLVASAVLFGVGAMMTSALLSIWSSDLFSDHPSVGFTVALMAYGLGLVVGPAALGALADATRLTTAFAIAAALAVPIAALGPRR